MPSKDQPIRALGFSHWERANPHTLWCSWKQDGWIIFVLGPELPSTPRTATCEKWTTGKQQNINPRSPGISCQRLLEAFRLLRVLGQSLRNDFSRRNTHAVHQIHSWLFAAAASWFSEITSTFFRQQKKNNESSQREVTQHSIFFTENFCLWWLLPNRSDGNGKPTLEITFKLVSPSRASITGTAEEQMVITALQQTILVLRSQQNIFDLLLTLADCTHTHTPAQAQSQSIQQLTALDLFAQVSLLFHLNVSGQKFQFVWFHNLGKRIVSRRQWPF